MKKYRVKIDCPGFCKDTIHKVYPPNYLINDEIYPPQDYPDIFEEIKEEERGQAKEKDLPSFDDIDLSLLHPRERARLERSFEAQHMSHDQKERLSRITEVRFDEAMREYTGFGVGGAVEALVTVKHVKGLKAVMEFAHDSGVSYLFLGKGRNLLVPRDRPGPAPGGAARGRHLEFRRPELTPRRQGRADMPHQSSFRFSSGRLKFH